MPKPLAEGGSEHVSRSDAKLNFWGLVLGPAVGAIVGTFALLWANSSKEHSEQEKAELKHEIRVLKETTPSPTPLLVTESTATETDRENKRLQRQIDASRTEMEASRKRAAELENELRILKEEFKEAKRRAELAAAAEPSPASTRPPAKPSETPPPHQRLERFIVEVPRAHSRGESATVYVRFSNTTNARIKLLLADGFLGQNKTFLVDDSGQHYSLDNSSGIGKCCFGFAGGDWQGAVLDLEPKGMGDITLTFRRRNRAGEVERQPQSFTLSAELTVGDVVKLQDWPSPQWQSSGSAGISVAGIVPQ
jgi:hypothetical protein